MASGLMRLLGRKIEKLLVAETSTVELHLNIFNCGALLTIQALASV